MVDANRIEALSRYWRLRVVGTVDHVSVNDRVHEDAGWNSHYLFMTVMSAGIAVLGLLLSSPAVVIGAMLISPLMGPIIGLGFALATVDAHQIRRAATAMAAGSVLAILFTAAVVTVSPLQNVTSELAARTRPNLFDLLVALFSALAGTYATIRGRSGTIVGVAIATALMPPLATVGFGLATLNPSVFGGALLLFVTNFVTIALTATVMARLYGFSPMLSPNQTMIQTVAIIATFAALAVPLGFSLRQLAWEGLASAAARSAVADTFRDDARISQVEVDYDSAPLQVSATVLTAHPRADANRVVAQRLEAALNRPVRVAVEQFRVGLGEADAAAAQQAATTSAADAAASAQAELVRTLALISGVDQSRILVDAEKRIAYVRAASLPGAGIATYRALETRLAGNAVGWRIQLVPPVTGDDVEIGDEGAPALADIAWAAVRRGDAVELSGRNVDAAAEALAKAGAVVTRGSTRGAARVRLVPPPITPPMAAATPAAGART